MSGEEGDAVVVTPWRAVVAVVSVLGLIVLARFGSRLVDVAGVVTTAVALAFLLAPLRSRLARHVGQSASLVITALATAVGVIVAGTVVLNDLRHQTAAVADLLVARIERLPSGSFLGRTVDALGIETSLTSWLGPSSNFVAGADTSTALGQQFVDLAVVVILATFLLANRRCSTPSCVGGLGQSALAFARCGRTPNEGAPATCAVVWCSRSRWVSPSLRSPTCPGCPPDLARCVGGSLVRRPDGGTPRRHAPDRRRGPRGRRPNRSDGRRGPRASSSASSASPFAGASSTAAPMPSAPAPTPERSRSDRARRPGQDNGVPRPRVDGRRGHT
ncbi:MAG: hypothetical protein R2715_22155 [Ilumatobacteraceae bacterium]